MTSARPPAVKPRQASAAGNPSGTDGRAMFIGDRVVDFARPDQSGRRVALSELLANGLRVPRTDR